MSKKRLILTHTGSGLFFFVTPCIENKERIVSVSVEIKASWENRAKRWAVPPTSCIQRWAGPDILGTPYTYVVSPVKNFRGVSPSPVIGVVKNKHLIKGVTKKASLFKENWYHSTEKVFLKLLLAPTDDNMSPVITVWVVIFRWYIWKMWLTIIHQGAGVNHIKCCGLPILLDQDVRTYLREHDFFDTSEVR